jgi:hypothetical protein
MTGYWDDRQNVIEYIKWLEAQLHITTATDWQQITTRDIKALKGQQLVTTKGGLPAILQLVYPHTDWSFLTQHKANSHHHHNNNNKVCSTARSEC